VVTRNASGDADLTRRACAARCSGRAAAAGALAVVAHHVEGQLVLDRGLLIRRRARRVQVPRQPGGVQEPLQVVSEAGVGRHELVGAGPAATPAADDARPGLAEEEALHVVVAEHELGPICAGEMAVAVLVVDAMVISSFAAAYPSSSRRHGEWLPECGKGGEAWK